MKRSPSCWRYTRLRVKAKFLRCVGFSLATAVVVLLWLTFISPVPRGTLSRLAAFAKELAVPTLLEDAASVGHPCRTSLRFSPVSLPVTALCSVQGSGNTWLRHLLQQLTGIYTGSTYPPQGDPELWARGYHGEGVRNGSVVAVKTHGLPSAAHFERAIILIRNPYDAIVADFNRRASGSHTGVASTQAFIKRWSAFPVHYAERWACFHTAWRNFTRPTLLVNFDKMVGNLEHEMKRISAFLRHPALETNISCALEDSWGVSKRKKATFDKSDLFSSTHIAFINKKIEYVRLLFEDNFPEEASSMEMWKLNETNFEDVWKPFPARIM